MSVLFLMKMDNLKRLDVLLVFTYAPAGLGHLRVTDALYDGLPDGVNSVLLGSEDTRITFYHRLMSVNPWVRRVMEWFQQEKQEQWFSRFYIWTLRSTTGRLYQQMKQLIFQQWHEKRVVVVVSTHFGLAHQLAKIKSKLEKNLNIRIILVVQVTDATSMKIWYVEGADLLSVPSDKVKTELLAYAQKKGLQKTDISILPYPVDKSFAYKFSQEEYEQRLNQYNPLSSSKINVMIPISGAAVGLNYYDKITSKLARDSNRFQLFLVVRNNIHTISYIRKMKAREYMSVIDSKSDKEVVDNYEKVYEKEIISLEIVKPSEQSFKALIEPNQRGGAILLLTQAIGKQEQDNLDFLLDHKLIPDEEDQMKLINHALEGKYLDEKDCRECLQKALNWRAIRLTNDPETDVKIISWCLKNELFSRMAKIRTDSYSEDDELASNGVEQFWKKVDSLVEIQA